MAENDDNKVDEKKKKKISKMNLQDIENSLKDVKEKMGGFDSQYAKCLLKRKVFLSSDIEA